jgi:hypothetical protein
MASGARVGSTNRSSSGAASVVSNVTTMLAVKSSSLITPVCWPSTAMTRATSPRATMPAPTAADSRIPKPPAAEPSPEPMALATIATSASSRVKAGSRATAWRSAIIPVVTKKIGAKSA